MTKTVTPLACGEGFQSAYECQESEAGPHHIWWIKNADGAVHIWARMSEWNGRKEWIGGVECHWPMAQEGWLGGEPSHADCWLIGGHCWHDGTSLYFSEHIAPFLPYPWDKEPHDMPERVHHYIAYELADWHRSRISASREEVEQ